MNAGVLEPELGDHAVAVFAGLLGPARGAEDFRNHGPVFGAAGETVDESLERRRQLLGLGRSGATISVNPCIPAVWPEYSLDWRIGGTRYRFTVFNPEHRCCGVASAQLDGAPVDARKIPLADDGGVHDVTIVIGADAGRGRAVATAARVQTP